MAAVVYQSSMDDVIEAAIGVYEVDGIPVPMSNEELTRIGLFSIKEDKADTGDSYISSDEEKESWVWYFCDETDLTPESFDDYDIARFWSHP